jgi:hypothetical protein
VTATGLSPAASLSGCSSFHTEELSFLAGEPSPKRLDPILGETPVGGDEGAALDRRLGDE